MNRVEIQVASQSKKLPLTEQFQKWVDAALTDNTEDFEIVIRIVDELEMIQFNEQYRNKKGSTNILSFPFEVPQGIKSNTLGDLLVCAPVIENEAQSQNKKLEDHWCHIIIHGVLHLLGYDHKDDNEAEEMEALEIKFLKTVEIKNPYKEM